MDTLRPEFITASNAILSRVNNKLIIRWKDHYPEKQHETLQSLFDTLNKKSRQGLPFLGSLGLRFEELHNKFKRGIPGF